MNDSGKLDFSRFDSIINGKMNPFYSLTESEKFLNHWQTISEPDEEPIKNYSIEVTSIIQIPPPDEKSDFFRQLIHSQYERTKSQAEHFFKNATNSEQIVFFYKKNIQRLKNYAKDAHRLELRMEEQIISDLTNPNSYIINFLKTYLIETILLVQDRCKSFTDSKIETQKELEVELYGDTQALNQSKNYTFSGEQITSWKELEIILTSCTTVDIIIKGNIEKLSYHSLGMAHKQNPDMPKAVWGVLKIFARCNGKISYKDSSDCYIERKKSKDRTIELNRYLKAFFNMENSIYKHHYRKNKCWETKFKISSRLETSQNPQEEPNISDFIDSNIEEIKRKNNISDSQLLQDSPLQKK